MFANFHLQKEPLSVRERMTSILSATRGRDFADFVTLFDPEEGRLGVAVTFIAILELLKEQLIEVVQSGAFAPIHIRAAEVEDPDAALESIEVEADTTH